MTNRRRAVAALAATAALVLSGQQFAAAAAGPAPTTTTVSVDSAKIVAIVGGQLGVAPSGTVTFKVDGHTVGSAALVATGQPLDGVGTATLNYHVKTGKTRRVTASYPGGGLYDASSKTIERRDPKLTRTITSPKPKTKFGWYRKPVTVAFHCVKHGSPISCPAPLHFSSNGKNQSGSATVYAANGGADTVKVKHINIDMQKPTLTVTGTGNRATCHARDELSGPRSCKVRHTTSHGVNHYRAVATDKAGNRRVVSFQS
jgi:hypothetical protein